MNAHVNEETIIRRKLVFHSIVSDKTCSTCKRGNINRVRRFASIRQRRFLFLTYEDAAGGNQQSDDNAVKMTEGLHRD